MRFVVFGAGAIGGVVGLRLAQHGHDVSLIARGEQLEAIRAGGLRLNSPEDTVHLHPPVYAHPSDVPWQKDDVVLMTMKSQDTEGALEALARHAPSTVRVACLQNGVENERLALRQFEHVYGVYVWCPTEYLQPGVVDASYAPVTGILDVGRYPSGLDAFAGELSSVFRSSTFYSEPRPDIMKWKYRKLLSNLGNAIDALCGDAARGSAIVAEVKREGVECLAAAGLEFTSDEEGAPREKSLPLRKIEGRARQGGSTWQSLARGRRTTECDYLNGEIVLLGRSHGIATPVNALLQKLARDAAEQGIPPGSMPIQDLERLVLTWNASRSPVRRYLDGAVNV